MTFAFNTPITIRCDGEDCNETLVSTATSEMNAVGFLLLRGWLVIKHDHFCPKHTNPKNKGE